MLRDLRHAAGMLRRNPAFAWIGIATLALGIGANTAIFSLVYGVLLRPVPFPDPQQLVSIKDDLRGMNLQDVRMSLPEMEDLRDRSGVFGGLTAIWPVDGNVTGGDSPERLEAMVVSPN